MNQLQILYIAVCAKDSSRLRTDEEFREINEQLKMSFANRNFKINYIAATRVEDLRAALLEHSPNLIHFSGHGTQQGIILEDNDGFSRPIPPTALANLFRLCNENIRGVILNACYSSEQATAIQEHVPHIVAMTDEITEQAALAFSKGFYNALANHKDIQQAYQFGKNAVEFENNTNSQIIQFFTNTTLQNKLGLLQLTPTQELEKPTVPSKNKSYLKYIFLLLGIIGLFAIYQLIPTENKTSTQENHLMTIATDKDTYIANEIEDTQPFDYQAIFDTKIIQNKDFNLHIEDAIGISSSGEMMTLFIIGKAVNKNKYDEAIKSNDFQIVTNNKSYSNLGFNAEGDLLIPANATTNFTAEFEIPKNFIHQKNSLQYQKNYCNFALKLAKAGSKKIIRYASHKKWGVAKINQPTLATKEGILVIKTLQFEEQDSYNVVLNLKGSFQNKTKETNSFNNQNIRLRIDDFYYAPMNDFSNNLSPNETKDVDIAFSVPKTTQKLSLKLLLETTILESMISF